MGGGGDSKDLARGGLTSTALSEVQGPIRLDLLLAVSDIRMVARWLVVLMPVNIQFFLPIAQYDLRFRM